MKANRVRYYNGAIVANFNGDAFSFDGGRLVMGFFGTLGSGTLKLQWCTDADTTWIDCGPQNAVVTTLAAAGTVSFYWPPGRLRVALTGSTTPSAQCWVGDAETGT
ncbi:MAG TPA: hypothetical protein VFG86_19830 [Chloroflexota bacterium]|nr:hypothetical protein [Chloroflexota bacterium]